MRWSQESVSSMVARTVSSPSRTTARGSSAPTARIAACGGLMTATKRRMPYMPRLGIVNVPAEDSGGVILAACTRSPGGREVGGRDLAVAHALGEVPGLGGDRAEALLVGVEDGRDDEGVLARDRD